MVLKVLKEEKQSLNTPYSSEIFTKKNFRLGIFNIEMQPNFADWDRDQKKRK